MSRMRKKGEKIKEGEKTARQDFSARGDGLSEREEKERHTLGRKRERERECPDERDGGAGVLNMLMLLKQTTDYKLLQCLLLVQRASSEV